MVCFVWYVCDGCCLSLVIACVLLSWLSVLLCVVVVYCVVCVFCVWRCVMYLFLLRCVCHDVSLLCGTFMFNLV